jgi:hypothetical protein
MNVERIHIAKAGQRLVEVLGRHAEITDIVVNHDITRVAVARRFEPRFFAMTELLVSAQVGPKLTLDFPRPNSIVSGQNAPKLTLGSRENTRL